MDKITSKDGTRIACWSAGSGPPLLLVHGAMADRSRWAEVSAPFEEQFTVYTIDRRGRGESDDGPQYSMQHECQDIVAVVESIGRRTTVLGHSYGADCALNAALLTDQIDRLVLYEPAVLEGATGFFESDRAAAAMRQAEEQLAAGETEPAMVTILRDIVELPEEDIEIMKSMPAWQGRVAAAHTVLRELRAEAAWIFDPAVYAGVTVPALLLMGSESYQVAKDGMTALHAALPNSTLVTLEGQGHGAITSAPDLFVRAVLTFLAAA